jgi:hypothetical protein
MGDLSRLAGRMIDVSERFADVVDAAEGRGRRKSRIRAPWLILPAAGAAAYALATSNSAVARRTRGLVARAGDLPDTDLLARVKEVTRVGDEPKSTNGSGGRAKARGSSGGNRRSRQTRSRRPAGSSAK